MKRKALIGLMLLTLCGCSSSFEEKYTINSGDGQKIVDGKKVLTNDRQLSLGEVEPFGSGNLVVLDMSGREVAKIKVLASGIKRDIKAMAWSKDSRQFAVLYSDNDSGTEVVVVCADGYKVCGTSKPYQQVIYGYKYVAFSKYSGFVMISDNGRDLEDLPIRPVAQEIVSSTKPENEARLDGGVDAEIETDGIVIEADAGKLKPTENVEDFETGEIPEWHGDIPSCPSAETVKVVGGKL